MYCNHPTEHTPVRGLMRTATSTTASRSAVLAFTLLVSAAAVPAAPAKPAAKAPAAGAAPATTAPAAEGEAASFATTAAVRPLLSAPNINILLVPFDSLSVPATGDESQKTTAPAIVPIKPAEAEKTASQVSRLRVETRALAKKKSNKPDPWADVFKLEPEAPSRPVNPDVRAGKTPVPDSGVMQAVPGPAAAPDVMAPLPAGPATLGDVGAPGAAQNAAAPLRRALMKVGFLDVLTSPPDGPAVRRVINDHRLSPRVLKTLQDNLRLIAASSAAPLPSLAPAAGEAEGEAPVASSPAASSPAAASPAATAGTDAPAKRDPIVDQVVTTASRLGQAMGYRSVVLMAVNPSPVAGVGAAARSATYTLMIVDSMLGTSELLSFDSNGADWVAANEGAASTSASWLLKKLALWPEVNEAQKAQMAADYFQQAKLMARMSDPDALDVLSQSLALDSTRAEAYVLLGDLLRPSDAAGAVAAYRRAVENSPANSGETYEKLAISYAAAKDWPRTLDAANRALAVRYDSAILQQTMAVAQFGRAELFRRAERNESADAADTEGRSHLERARAMSPDDPAVTQLLAQQYMNQGRYAEAASALDELMTRIEPSLELQTLYATALSERRGREVEAFVAWSRVWKMSGARNATLTATRYRRLAEGYDRYSTDLARQAAQQAAAVANGTVPREGALLQLQEMKDAMTTASAAANIMQPPSRGTEGGTGALEAAHASRVFAASLFGQALESYSVFIETGDDSRRGRALELHRQAINQLNAARGGGPR